MDDWLAKKMFKSYVTCDYENVLSSNDFKRMLEELDPTVSAEEADAWFHAIDEDDSGEVSLEEFLNSKVLKVKRLFDQYDVDNSRTAAKDEMIQILRSLNDQITPEEADSLYQYADLDGNGEISFAEFLENNLLKMLQIFDEFDTDRKREFNESQMKILIKKLDPFLDDSDVHQMYKAIDTDGGGSVSFTEFVESHVLRAKSLFDRYDIDRSRALTQFKFRELMLDMDSTLTVQHMEVIYNLVSNPNTGKVHLGGFLNPNIVKLKLLFDKYDQDRSRALDQSEFKQMLHELFKSATEKDIEELQRTIIPAGIEVEVSLTEYIERFKEIQRKHDLIQLAKRRQAREKARKLGLKYEQD
jgi:Ca2+-binding EF-hand superfamily protein